MHYCRFLQLERTDSHSFKFTRLLQLGYRMAIFLEVWWDSLVCVYRMHDLTSKKRYIQEINLKETSVKNSYSVSLSWIVILIRS